MRTKVLASVWWTACVPLPGTSGGGARQSGFCARRSQYLRKAPYVPEVFETPGMASSSAASSTWNSASSTCPAARQAARRFRIASMRPALAAEKYIRRTGRSRVPSSE